MQLFRGEKSIIDKRIYLGGDFMKRLLFIVIVFSMIVNASISAVSKCEENCLPEEWAEINVSEWDWKW